MPTIKTKRRRPRKPSKAWTAAMLRWLAERRQARLPFGTATTGTSTTPTAPASDSGLAAETARKAAANEVQHAT